MRKLTAILTLLCVCVSAQAGKQIPNGSTSQSISVIIFDNDGDPNTGVTITDLDLYVTRDGAFSESTKIDLVALATVTTAWTSGRAIHKGRGNYRIDIPDANMSDGDGVLLVYAIEDGTGGNRIQHYEVQLETATIAAIPTAAANATATWANASGVVVIADANTAAVIGDDWTNGGRLDLLLDLTVADANTGAIQSTAAVAATTTAQMRTNVWTAAAASYDVEDSFGNIINDMVAEYATDGVYYLAALDEDSTAIDLDSTTVSATLGAAGVDLIFDELLSGHTTVGSAGEALTTAARKRGY